MPREINAGSRMNKLPIIDEFNDDKLIKILSQFASIKLLAKETRQNFRAPGNTADEALAKRMRPKDFGDTP